MNTALYAVDHPEEKIVNDEGMKQLKQSLPNCPEYIQSIMADVKTSNLPGAEEVRKVCEINNPFGNYKELNNETLNELVNKFKDKLIGDATVYVCCVYEGDHGLLESTDVQTYVLSNLGFNSVNIHFGLENRNIMVYSQNVAGRTYFKIVREATEKFLEELFIKNNLPWENSTIDDEDDEPLPEFQEVEEEPVEEASFEDQDE